MENFSDAEHSVADMVFQGSELRPLGSLRNEDLMEAIRAWEIRDDVTDPAVHLLRLADTNSFCISYEGESDRHWPCREATFVSEAIVREALFRDGICKLTEFDPTLIYSRFKLMATSGVEQLLVCPYRTKAGNIAGVLVVSVGKIDGD